MLKQRILLYGLLLLLPIFSKASGTGIGNGGDPVFSFLESTRYAYVETLKSFSLDQSIHDSFCQSIARLSGEQKSLCRAFVAETIPQLLDLNLAEKQTEFVLRQEPLLVEGPDGKLMPVAARTELGPKGPIELHRLSIQYYSPAQMLFLIAHEFGHKVIFRGHPLTDNEHIGPFASGRELLDSAAEALVVVAESKGRIGKNFGLRDFWQCQIVYPNGAIAGLSAASFRLFFQNSWDQYEGGISRRPDDPQIFAYESLNSRLLFRILINEKLGCLSEASSSKDRNTRLDIVRIKDQAVSSAVPSEEVLASLELPLVNPICEEKPRWLELSAGEVTFRCQYMGSQGGFQ